MFSANGTVRERKKNDDPIGFPVTSPQPIGPDMPAGTAGAAAATSSGISLGTYTGIIVVVVVAASVLSGFAGWISLARLNLGFFTPSVNATQGTFGSLTISGPVTFSNQSAKVFYVGATRQYKNLTSVLSLFAGQLITNTTIYMDAGLYNENVDIGNVVRSTASFIETNPLQVYSEGLRILGDNRTFVGITYVNQHPLAIDTQYAYRVTTNLTGVGPDTAFLSSFSVVGPVTAQAVLVDTGVGSQTNDGCSTPFANAGAVNGRIAIMQRGNCGFLTKAQNAVLNGAVGAIIYMSSSEFFQAGGGVPNEVNIPVVTVSETDGAALVTGVLGFPFTQVSITPNLPQFGFSAGNVTLSHPGGNLAVVQVDVVGGNPDFGAIGVVPGDTVSATMDDGTGLPQVVRRTVTVVNGNQLTLNSVLPNPLIIDSSITLLPNVRIQGVNVSVPTFSVHDSGLFLQGVTLQDNPAWSLKAGLPVLSVAFDGSVLLSNVVVDSSLAQTLVAVSLISDSFLQSGFRQETLSSPNVLTVIGGQVLNQNSNLKAQNLVVINMAQAASSVTAMFSNMAVSNRFQSIWGAIGGINPGGALYTIGAHVNLGYLDMARCYSTFTGNGFGLWLDQNSEVVVYYTTTISTCDIAGGPQDGSQLNLYGNTLIDNVYVGFYGQGGSIVQSSADVTFTNVFATNYVFDDTASLDVYYSNYAPYNQLVWQAPDPGPFTVDPDIHVQILTNGFKMMLMDPTAFGFLTYEYVGHDYMLVNGDGSQHVVCLYSGDFVGIGVGPGNCCYEFGTNVGGTFRFRVLSNNMVVVIGVYDGLFGCKKRKRDDISNATYFDVSRSVNLTEVSPQSGGSERPKIIFDALKQHRPLDAIKDKLATSKHRSTSEFKASVRQILQQQGKGKRTVPGPHDQEGITASGSQVLWAYGALNRTPLSSPATRRLRSMEA